MTFYLTMIDDPDDREYFKELYDKYHKMMFDCSMKILKNHHDAEDAVQQILLNLWKNISNIKKVSDSKLAGYLYVTARNYCYGLTKKNKISFISLDDNPELVLLNETTPEHIIIKRFDFSILDDAFNELPPRYRQIIMDKTILHLSDEQAAVHIKIKTTYVRECLYRARAALNTLYLKKLEESEVTAGTDKK